MHPVSSHDPFFYALMASAFERDHIADLAAGRCAAIRVPGFMSPSTCEDILRVLEDAQFDSYGTERVYPPVMRFGVGVSDYRQDGRVTEKYWEAVNASQKAWSGLGLSYDPFKICRDALAEYWPNTVAVGRRNDGEMGAGVIRQANQGFQVHFDDAVREFTGNLLNVNLVTQFAFNLYLSVPKVGGETMVWRHRWHPADEAFRLPRSYGYAEAVVGDAESFELKPTTGEALLFDPRNFHAVRPSHDSSRITLGFAVGLSDAGELLTWG